jgi:hypothetical protein
VKTCDAPEIKPRATDSFPPCLVPPDNPLDLTTCAQHSSQSILEMLAYKWCSRSFLSIAVGPMLSALVKQALYPQSEVMTLAPLLQPPYPKHLLNPVLPTFLLEVERKEYKPHLAI